MSERDYNAAYRTPLADLHKLPRDLRLAFLARQRSRCVLGALVKKFSGARAGR